MNIPLRQIRGVEISNLPFKLEWVGNLLFFNGPLIAVYKDEKLNIFIKSWLEANSDSVRHLFFQIDPHLLLGYLTEDVPFVDVLLNPCDNLYFVVDKMLSNQEYKFQVLSSAYLHHDYIPKINSFFDEEDSEDVETIMSTFKLNDLISSEGEVIPFDILEEAQSHQSDLINIHLRSKNGIVGYGKVQSHVLAETLTQYHKVAEATVVSLFNNKKVGFEGKSKTEDIKKLAVTDYAYSKAASFSAFLKPAKVEVDEEGVSSSEKIHSTIFNLFQVGEDVKEIEKHPEFSQEMLSAFSSFLKVVSENDLQLTIQYGNPVKDYKYSNSFDKEKSTKIIYNLSIPIVSEPIRNTYVGFYDTIRKRRRGFEFLTNTGEFIDGTFSPELYANVHTFRLDLEYTIVVVTQSENVAGKRKPIKRHTIVSCVLKEK